MAKHPAVRFLLVVLLLLGSSGCSTPGGRSGNGLFSELDTNHDGKVTREEFERALAEKKFQAIDKDSDGSISLEEWQRTDTSPQAKAHFTIVDKDGNGKVTFLEFLSAVDQHSNAGEAFTRLDKNLDNTLSQNEVMERNSLPIVTFHF